MVPRLAGFECRDVPCVLLRVCCASSEATVYLGQTSARLRLDLQRTLTRLTLDHHAHYQGSTDCRHARPPRALPGYSTGCRPRLPRYRPHQRLPRYRPLPWRSGQQGAATARARRDRMSSRANRALRGVVGSEC
eukprot:scaffold39451_cov51-Phaeocystis_antarctica.AAC.2